ncbi:hypothetical protein [Rossellomorea vietnamensis]|nr:hypothetical protein [Rossellomorea vietnamensis]
MELNYKTSPNYQAVPRKQYTVRTVVLNIMGIVFFGGLLLQSVTLPISLNSSGELSHIEEIKMSASDFLEYALFTLGCGILYYFLVNIYFLGEKWRKVFFIIIALLGFFSIYMVFYLLLHPPSH